MKNLFKILVLSLCTFCFCQESFEYEKSFDYYDNGDIKRIYQYNENEELVYKKTFYNNGNIESETNYKNGKKHGICTVHYNSGVLKLERYYKNGKKDGFSRMFFENGDLKIENFRRNGMKHGRCIEYYSNGNLLSERYYKFGKRYGTSTIFYSNGNIEHQLPFNGMSYNGIEIQGYENGQKRIERVYDEGDLVLNIRYDENGNIERIIEPEKIVSKERMNEITNIIFDGLIQDDILQIELYMGSHSLSLGGGPRIRKIYTSQDGLHGEFLRNKPKERNMFLEKYNNSILSEDEIDILKIEDIKIYLKGKGSPDRKLYRKFVDFYYYGKRLGKMKETSDILNKVHPSLKKEVLESIDPYIFNEETNKWKTDFFKELTKDKIKD